MPTMNPLSSSAIERQVLPVAEVVREAPEAGPFVLALVFWKACSDRVCRDWAATGWPEFDLGSFETW